MFRLRAAAPTVAHSVSTALAAVAVATAVLFAVVLAAFSLRWPLVHDLPIFLYDGYLMRDLGRVPYRDFYEINAPGTLLVFGLVHQITGGASLALRIIDLAVLAAISALTVFALRAHGARSGLLAASCFAIAYLAEGPVHSLQREYLSVLALAISLAVIFRRGSPATDPLSTAVAGLLGGAVASIKPLLVVCWLPLLAVALVARLREQAPAPAAPRLFRAGVGVIVPFLLGLAIVPGLIAAWMIRTGALGDYLEIARNYYPLYAELKGNGSLWHAGSVADALQRYVGSPLELIPRSRFAIVAFVGLLLAWKYKGRPAFAQCVAICGIVICAVVYVVLAGKFWVYHRFPLSYGLALLAGLSLSRELSRAPGESSWNHAIVCVALAAALPLGVVGREFFDWREGRTFVVKDGRVDVVADYLRDHVGPAETVLALDVTSGAIHGLYRDRRPLYGRFIYDHHFYHHVDHPYIQRLRRELLAQFKDGRPDVVVRADDTWLRTRDFPELEAILSAEYEVALRENDISILRRRPRASGPASAARVTPPHMGHTVPQAPLIRSPD